MDNEISDKKRLFSIFMCARNAETTIRKAVDSVMRQAYENWELIIVDNGSTDTTWEIIEALAEMDSRIKGLHLEKGIGWAKGASLCLEHAEGVYMTFLAADDFLIGDGSLHAVARGIREEAADLVFVGYASVQLEHKGYCIGGGVIPEYKTYGKGDKVQTIFEIMNDLYYNSFFHYIKMELLRENGIDFFMPFYADYEGMTEAMCRAEKIMEFDQCVYALTVNTSQTAGAVTWKHNTSQWKSICRAVCEEGKYEREKLRYIAIRIFNNNAVMLKGICNGMPLRDLEMNPVSKTSLQRLQYMKEALELPEYCEMFYYAGRSYFAESIMEGIKDLYEQCIRDGYSREDISETAGWLDCLVAGLYDLKCGKLIKRNVFHKESVEFIRHALCDEANRAVFGYELVGDAVPYIAEEAWREICESYASCSLRQIYTLMFRAMEIKKRGRMAEVIIIIKECMELMRQVGEYISKSDLQQVTDDLKLVLS